MNRIANSFANWLISVIYFQYLNRLLGPRTDQAKEKEEGKKGNEGTEKYGSRKRNRTEASIIQQGIC